METRLPFSGFYYSIWLDGISREDELLTNKVAEKYGVRVEPYLFVDYESVYKGIAQEYPKYLGEIFDVKLSFTIMTSPRKYNFQTDRIFAEIDKYDAYKLYRQVGKKAVREMAKKLFTSRDGFISHYSPNIDDWGQLRNWDYNQVYCMLEAWLEKYNSDWEVTVFEKMSDVISFAYSNAVDFEALYVEVGQMLGREMQQNSERIYPVVWKDTEDYVKRYYKLNGLGV